MDRWMPELFLISLLAAFCGGLAWIHDHELFAAAFAAAGINRSTALQQGKLPWPNCDDDPDVRASAYPVRHAGYLEGEGVLSLKVRLGCV